MHRGSRLTRRRSCFQVRQTINTSLKLNTIELLLHIRDIAGHEIQLPLELSVQNVNDRPVRTAQLPDVFMLDKGIVADCNLVAENLSLPINRFEDPDVTFGYEPALTVPPPPCLRHRLCPYG